MFAFISYVMVFGIVLLGGPRSAGALPQVFVDFSIPRSLLPSLLIAIMNGGVVDAGDGRFFRIAFTPQITQVSGPGS